MSMVVEKGTARQTQVTWGAIAMCALAMLYYCYEYFLRVAPSAMKQELMQAYNISYAGFGALLAYYYHAYVPLQFVVGSMMDWLGPRKVLTFACLFCVAGTYLFGYSGSLGTAMVGRFLVGFGSAFAYVGVLKLASIWLPRRYFALVAGICTTLGMLGAIVGGLLTAELNSALGWRKNIHYSGIVGLILAVVLWFFIRENGQHKIKAINVDKKHEKWEHWEEKDHEKLSLAKEMLAVFKMPQLWLNGCIGCLAFLPLTIFGETWAIAFLEALGLPKESAALGSACVFLGFAFGGPIWGWLSDAMQSRRKPLMLGTFLAALATFGFMFYSSNVYLVYAGIFLCGAFASAEILVFAVANDLAKPNISATAVSFTNALVMVGGQLLPPLIGFILDTLNLSAKVLTPELQANNFKYALLILPCGLLFCAFLTCLSKESYRA